MAWTGRNGKKCHNWTTNTAVAESETDQLARQLIDGCSMLTPRVEALIDEELRLRTPQPRVIGDGEEPDPDVLAAMNQEQGEDVEPTMDDLKEIEAEDMLATDNEGI